jgi:hypothetical protein
MEGVRRFLGSLVPIATWLNPHSTTGLAIEVSKFFNIQFNGNGSYVRSLPNFRWPQTLGSPPVGALGQWKGVVVAMGMSVEDAYRVQGTD